MLKHLKHVYFIVKVLAWVVKIDYIETDQFFHDSCNKSQSKSEAPNKCHI